MTPGRTVTSPDGVPIVYEVQGDGPETVVFIHGWTCNRSHWRGQIQAFLGRYRTIAIDLGGHGESGQDRSEWTMSAFAQDVVAVMDEEQVTKAVLVGHSMGGRVILNSARLLRQQVVGLIGADTFKDLRSKPPTERQVGLMRDLQDDYESAASAFVARMFTSDTPAFLKKRIVEGMQDTPGTVGIGALSSMMADEPSFDIAASLFVPIITINALDSPMDFEAARDAGVLVRFVTTTGHFVMNEDPETFSRLMGEALELMF